MICLICNKEFSHLSTHIVSKHHVSTKEYYDKFIRKENEGKCINCGKDALLEKGLRGYTEYCSIKCYRELRKGSVNYWLKKGFSEEEAKIKNIEFNKIYIKTEAKLIEKYGEQNGKERWEAIVKHQKSGMKERLYKKYGEILGEQKYQEHLIKVRENSPAGGLKYWIKVCNGDEELAKQKYKDQCTTMTKEKFIGKFGEEDGIKKWGEYIEFCKHKQTKEGFEERYGKEEGDKKWANFIKKSAQTEENFIERHGEELGKIKYQEYLKKIANTLENYCSKHGEELGTIKYQTHIKNIKDNSKMSLEYWLKECNGNIEDATKKLKEIQHTFSLKLCIEKLGEEKGHQRWKDRQEKWQNTLKSKSQEEIKEINRKKSFNNPTDVKYSKFQLEICEMLKPFFNDLRYGNDEIYLCEDTRHFYYDICYRDKIIECNGTYWHCDPNIYDENFLNTRTGKTAKQTWEFDEHKINLAKNNGFEVLTIWEKEYNKNKEETIQKCITFLKGE